MLNHKHDKVHMAIINKLNAFTEILKICGIL